MTQINQNSVRRPNKPELMSPAGGWSQLQTAIEAGADAVYFGLNHFSARAKVGFSLEELPEVMETLHARGVKGFVTFNTLVFDHELEQAETAILEMAAAGVDALIVQDVGVAQLIQKIAPDLDIHGSTQMSITSAQGAELARSFGCCRVVLGRELSLADIRKIAEATDMELEIFVHGALCVSYSGQCFSSEAWGGRSANRGKCAQACRLSYDLIVDGEPRDLGPYRYLLSPGDLYALEQIPELVDIGVACVKIEGRYKDAQYVALTTRAYREAIDLAAMSLPNEVDAEEKLQLEQIYSRGLGPHFMAGTNHQTVVTGRSPRHRGVHVATVTKIGPRTVHAQIEHPIKRGDGVVFDAADWRSPDEPEEGGNVYDVHPRSDHEVELEFGHQAINFSRIRVGDLIWRTNDPQLIKGLKSITQTEVPVFTRPLSFVVTAQGGMPIQIVAQLESGLTATYIGSHPLEPAEKRALDLDILTDKLGRLGGTPFHLKGIQLISEDQVFVPTSGLNQARRQLVDELFEALGKCTPIATFPSIASEQQRLLTRREQWADAQPSDPATQSSESAVAIHLLVRTPEQLEAALTAARELNPARPNDPVAATGGVSIGSITLDYLELYGLRPSVEQIRDAGIVPRVASPRILKPSEQNVIRFLTTLDSQILVRSGGLLHDLIQETDPAKRPLLTGDFSLNAANALSVWSYLEMGVARITPTYDLNAQQITDLIQWVPASALEIIAYSHLPVFHTEHCVFCRFLSDGTDSSNCGHPCEKHQVSVRDAQGRAHPVMADVGCRNTVFGAQAQTDPTAVETWQKAGISNFRIEFVHQSAAQVQQITSAFANYFSSQTTSDELSGLLEQLSPQQTTQGSLFVPHDFKNLVQIK